MSYWVYILTNHTNHVLYVGVTNDLIRRVYEHKTNKRGFTRKYNFEEAPMPGVAKAGSRQKKLNLIAQLNPLNADLYLELADEKIASPSRDGSQ